MNVLPRTRWTSQPCRSVPGSDSHKDLPYYRLHEPRQIAFYSYNLDQIAQNVDPGLHFEEVRHAHYALGHSDIDFNLGVVPNVEGVWSLRGIINKSAANDDPDINASTISVYIAIGAAEKPTDTLLRNVLDARRLVLSRYSKISGTVDYTHNPYINKALQSDWFWEHSVTNSNLNSKPVGIESLPPPDLLPGMQNVHVQTLQDQLAYWGYYRSRVDGVYTERTQDAVKSLAADLKDGMFYPYDITGFYDRHLQMAWFKFLQSQSRVG